MRDRKILKKLQESIHETQKVSDVKISRAQSEESIKETVFFISANKTVWNRCRLVKVLS